MPFADTNDKRQVYYEMHGEGEPLLYIGGWGLFTGDHFENIAEDWREKFRIVVADYPGIGRSSPLERPSTSAALAEDAVAALDAAGMERMHVIGEGGLGAAVAQILAARYPNRVIDAVMTSGWAWPEPYHDVQLRALRAMRAKGTFEDFRMLVTFLSYLPQYVNEATSPLVSSYDGEDNVASRRGAHLDLIDANISHDARAELDEIVCPCLVICGGEDLLGGPRLARDLASRIGDAELVVLDGVPHVFSSVTGGRRRYLDAVNEFLGIR